MRTCRLLPWDLPRDYWGARHGQGATNVIECERESAVLSDRQRGTRALTVVVEKSLVNETETLLSCETDAG